MPTVKRHANYRRAKIHRNYTVEDVADLFDVHKNTVRAWIKAGLPTCGAKRPVLILGIDLANFLRARRTKNKRPCKPGEFYCFRCRVPKSPAEGMTDLLHVTDKVGHLKALCPDCLCVMNRRVSMSKLAQVWGKMDITFPQALEQVSESTQPNVNSDLR